VDQLIVILFEVLTSVIMKSTVFWDLIPCRALKFTNVSAGYTASTFRVEEQAKQAASKLGLLLDPEDGGNMFL
jgi:hypothetical protein